METIIATICATTGILFIMGGVFSKDNSRNEKTGLIIGVVLGVIVTSSIMSLS